MPPESYPWLALLPPAIAVICAFWTRQIVVSLFLGLVAAAGIWNGLNPLKALVELHQRLVSQLADPGNAAVLMLLPLIGGFVALLQASGTAEAFLRRYCGRFRSPRAVRTLTAVSGLCVFFSDSASPLLRGPIFAGLFDRLGQSRAKLAFLLDATAAPVSSIVPLSPWTAVVIALVTKQVAELRIVETPIQLVLTAIGYQFYAIAILVIALLVAWFDILFSGMRAADRKAQQMDTLGETSSADAMADADSNALKATPWGLPISLALLVGMLALVIISGAYGLVGENFAANPFRGSIPGISMGFAVAAAYLAWVVLRSQSIGGTQLQKIWFGGAMRMTGIMLVLLLAWTLGAYMHELGTGDYLAKIVQATIPLTLIPAAIFLASSLASFFSGTAWGCYALFIPIAMPLAVEMELSLPLVLGAVISGSLFGDHCSPFSDTTILSSAGAECDHLQHVQTQLPYALVGMTAALIAFVVASAASLVLAYVVLVVSIGVPMLLVAGMRNAYVSRLPKLEEQPPRP